MNKSPHAAAIDRIGGRIVRDHFQMTRQSLFNWRQRGVPEKLHNAFRLLAMSRGVEVPELNQEYVA